MSDKNMRERIPEMSLKKNVFGRWAGIFIKRFRITILIVIALAIWGAGNYGSLQREAQPKVTIPYAYVTTIYVGATPKEVETLITEPIEKRLDEIDGVKEITSSSSIGSSLVFLEFETGEDIDEKVREAKEKLSGISSELPDDAQTPEVFDMKTGQSPVLVYALSGNDDILTLQSHAKKLQKDLELAVGVKEVVIVGGLDREIRITVDPYKLSLYGLTVDQIDQALTSSNVSFPGGNVELNGKNYSVTTPGKFEKVEDIERVIVATRNNSNIYLKDVADVMDTYEDQDVYIKSFTRNQQDNNLTSDENTLILAVLRKESADEVGIKESVEQRLKNNQDKLIADTMSLTLMGDKANYINDQLGSVTNNAISGLCLVIIVLFLFIGFREALIVSFVIPMSLLASFGLLKMTGNTLNNITMFSLVLAVGMLVDNAIVVMENIDRLRNKGLTANVASSVATNQIAPAIFASTLTTVAAFTPMLFSSGIMGDFIRPIPQTIIITLTCSFFMAVTITPSVCAVMLKARQKEGGRHKAVKIFSILLVVVLSLIAFADFTQRGIAVLTPVSYVAAVFFGGGMALKQFAKLKSGEDHFIINTYARGLSWVIEKTSRKLVFLSAVFIIFILCLSMPFTGMLPVEMFGGEDMPSFTIRVETPNGSTGQQTRAITQQLEAILLEIPEVEDFVSYTGTSSMNIFSDLEITDSDNPMTGAIEVNLVDDKDRERTSSEIAAYVRSTVRRIPGADIEVGELESGPPSGSPLYVKLIGDNLDNLERTVTDFEEVLKSMEGIRDVRTSLGEGSPQLKIEVDKEKAALMGLSELSIAASVRSAINGIVSTTLRDNEEDIDIVIRTSDQVLNTVYDIEKLSFYNNQGVAIPFTQVATVVETESIQGIAHEDGKRIVHVAADIDDTKWTSAEALKAFEAEIEDYVFPEGVSLSYGGEMEAMGDSFGDMMLNMVMAALLVYIILAVQFNSLSQPFIILLTVPLSIIGVMLGLLLTGNNFGFVAFVGVVALVGIAVNDAIVLIDYTNYLRTEGYSIKDAIRETGVARFIPVMATTITTSGGILPITMEDPFFAPLGVALIAGLSVATVLTLVVVPTMYSLLEEGKLKRQKKREEKKNSSGRAEELLSHMEYEI